MTLKQLAMTVAQAYEKNSKVEAIYIAGSLSREWADEHSDIELNILWAEAPDKEDRLAVINEVQGEIIDFHEYEENEWSEAYRVEGVKLEISSFLTESVLRSIQRVTKEFDTNVDDQCIVASIHYGIPLYGEELLDGLKAKVLVYPEQLSGEMIDEYSRLEKRWDNRQALLEREDWLMFYSVLTSVQSRIMGLLFGLNCMYVHHPSYKWQKDALETMNIKPDHIHERVNRVFLERPSEGLKEMEAIVEDVRKLVEDKE
ncbi:DUF4037 domain-containing protein [Halobacillus sp. Marseille-Q1614]|uniref:DUF4037 domain-containing protein n=1 Tax=Halobacillus sp. Marseille-Q1614 TaxID=2709134 RepID=UPI00156F085A|nr:DUF4037 domain-containing protein [Halobacillus sp. Marseille-Q1614]